MGGWGDGGVGIGSGSGSGVGGVSIGGYGSGWDIRARVPGTRPGETHERARPAAVLPPRSGSIRP
jgi:hypothetical protein